MEKSLKISCAEIAIVRLVCNRCKTAIDLPLDRLQHGGIVCPGCKDELRKAGVDKSLTELANALRHLQRESGISVEFVIPLPE